MKKPRLLIISDTPMWQGNGQIHVLESTLREVEMLTKEFENITWLGFKWAGESKGYGRADSTDKIRCITLPLLGGGGLWNKLKQVMCLPWFFVRVLYLILTHKYIHTRAPSVPAGMAIFISKYDKRRHYWHKFAGNWVRENPPKSYLWQKNMLLKARHTKVTINGNWPGLPAHVLPFENPCFTEDELRVAAQAAAAKKFLGKLEILFVGRIEYAKGVDRIFHSINLLPAHLLDRIGMLRLVGGGSGKAFEEIIELAKTLKVPYEFTGPLGRKKLDKLYAQSHIFFFPSDSEGFPKVVAEAAAYGCIPVVSDVSAIGQYVKDGENGTLLQSMESVAIAQKLGDLIQDTEKLPVVAAKATDMAKLYTYERYNERIAAEVFNLR